MSKPKFKVGDKVRLKKSVKVGDRVGGFELFDSMHGDLQKPHKITKIAKYYVPSGFMSLVAGWYVPVEWLEHIKPEKIIIYRNGAEVVAKNTATGKTGVARCNPADEFDFNTGAKLAFERLTNPEPEKPKYYTGKVVCVSPFSCLFTRGKVYEIKDGVGKDDEGNIIMIHRPKSFAEFSQNLKSKFIELVE